MCRSRSPLGAASDIITGVPAAESNAIGPTWRAPWTPPRDRVADCLTVVVWVVGAVLAAVFVFAVLPLFAPSDPSPESGVEGLQREQITRLVIAIVAMLLLVAVVVSLRWWTRRRRRRVVFRSPPGWPATPDGWRPGVGWQPLSDWPDAPDDWVYWGEPH